MEIKDIIKKGRDAEVHVAQRLVNEGFDLKYKDSYYDYDVEDIKLEIKSTGLIIKNGGQRDKDYQYAQYGRFEFTDIDNRKLQRKNKCWYCFVVRIGDCFEIIGFAKAKTIKAQKYVTLKHIMNNRRIYVFDKWCEMMKEGKDDNN